MYDTSDPCERPSPQAGDNEGVLSNKEIPFTIFLRNVYYNLFYESMIIRHPT